MTVDFESIIHTLWNAMTIDQRDKFLRNAPDSIANMDCNKWWFELSPIEENDITQWFLERLGLT